MYPETERAIKATHKPAIEEMQKYVRRNEDGTFTLDVASAADIGVDPGAFANLKHCLDETNRMIKDGRLQAHHFGRDLR